ncbi:MAG: DUF6463 family protein [Kineosporiaceae bacterium]
MSSAAPPGVPRQDPTAEVPGGGKVRLRADPVRPGFEIGIVHLALIGVLGAGELGEIVDAGLVNGLGDAGANIAGGDLGRAAVFWLFYLGVPFLLLGQLARWAQQQLGVLPAAFGWTTVFSGLVGWIVVPVSGFPLLVALGVYTVVTARRETDERALNGSPMARRERL